jgi:hypothetical protein
MNSRRLSCLILGLWLGGGVVMAWIAGASFRSVDRVLNDTQYASGPLIRTLGPAKARVLLRFQTAEQNGYYFETWEIAQLFLGLTFFVYLLLGTRERKTPLLLVMLMMITVLAQRFYLTPNLATLARDTELAALTDPGFSTKRFWILHNTYFGVELTKWAFGIALAVYIILQRRRGRSSSLREKLDAINKANYRHVDR